MLNAFAIGPKVAAIRGNAVDASHHRLRGSQRNTRTVNKNTKREASPRIQVGILLGLRLLLLLFSIMVILLNVFRGLLRRLVEPRIDLAHIELGIWEALSWLTNSSSFVRTRAVKGMPGRIMDIKTENINRKNCYSTFCCCVMLYTKFLGFLVGRVVRAAVEHNKQGCRMT